MVGTSLEMQLLMDVLMAGQPGVHFCPQWQCPGVGRSGEGLLSSTVSPALGLSLWPSTAAQSTVACKSYTYKCRNGLCISKQNPECDGQKDCEDNSDEDNCSEYPSKGNTWGSGLGRLDQHVW